MLTCSNCHSRKAIQCAACTSTALAAHNVSYAKLQASHERHTRRATALLDGPGGMDEVRLLDARIANGEAARDDAQQEIQRLEGANEELQSRVQALTRSLATRRNNLNRPSPTSQAFDWIEEEALYASPYPQALDHVRRVLLCEVLDIFDVPRPAEGEEEDEYEWTVDGLRVPETVQELGPHPSEDNQTALLYTAHILILFHRYLSTPLPYLPALHPPVLTPLPSLVDRPSLPLNTSLPFLQYTIAYLACSHGIPVALAETSNPLRVLARLARDLGPHTPVPPPSLDEVVAFAGQVVAVDLAATSVRKEDEREKRRQARKEMKANETKEEASARRAEERKLKREKEAAKKERDERRARERDEWEVVEADGGGAGEGSVL